MCGIFGIWNFNNQPIDLEAVEGATRRLRHRGPDDEGYLFLNTNTGRKVLCAGIDTTAELDLPPLGQFKGDLFELGLGFRRLSILDISPAGHQPMTNADGKCWIIYNGEIYNYIELRSELSKYGYSFQTGTDTEVILAAYQHWGVDCLTHFNGMWAFAIWDDEKSHLFLARDRFGIKPLYYCKNEERLIFASEIKALLAHPGANRRANPSRLYEYLHSGLTDYGDETLFENIQQLPAAHYLIVSKATPKNSQARRYWEISFDRQLDLSFAEARSRLRELFLDSVRLHLRSDVRVGAALSGGIDSSAIVASMRMLEPQLDLHTFSYTADDPLVSEERWVDIVGQTSRAAVHKVQPTPEELVADLDALIESQDEPFGSTSIYAQSRVFRLAHENGVKVMLDGQGADEMLAGYRLYLSIRLASLLRGLRLAKANQFVKAAAGLPGSDTPGSLSLLASAGGALLPESFGLLRNFLKRSRDWTKGTNANWLDESWFVRQGVIRRKTKRPQSRYMLQEQLYGSLAESSLPMLLRYEDRNSMAQSIESRVPFLTSDLAEFILALPEEYIIASDGTSKSVFRQAMRGIVPDEILDRRDKIGFATPEKRWLEAVRPWIEQVLSSDVAAQVPGMKLPTMKQQWKAISRGEQAFDFRIWRWLNTIRWAQKFEVVF
jgi:asparagine synthase (glutamine-hydrolysing)